MNVQIGRRDNADTDTASFRPCPARSEPGMIRLSHSRSLLILEQVAAKLFSNKRIEYWVEDRMRPREGESQEVEDHAAAVR